MSDHLLLRVADLIIGRPLLIHPAKAEVILFALRERLGVDAPAPAPEASARFGARRPEGRSVSMIGDAAVIPIVGALANRFDLMDAMSGVTAYETLDAQIRAAAADPDVASILLDLDSPGGEVAGMFRLAETLRAVRQTKRVVAYVDDMAASAGYGLAAQAHEIVASPTSMLGSIGVVLVHLDRSGELAKKGVAATLIHAGAHKVDGHPYGPLPEGVRADLQQEVDNIYGQFVDLIAAGRPGLTPGAIRATEARTYTGAAAVEGGLADRIASLDEVLADLRLRSALRAAPGQPGARSMTDHTQPGASAPGAAAQADLDRARAEGEAAGRAAGAAAERARIAAILDHPEAAGRESLARHLAFKTDTAPEAAADLLKASPKADAAPDPLKSLAAEAPAVVLGAAAPAGESRAAAAKVVDINAVYADRAKAMRPAG